MKIGFIHQGGATFASYRFRAAIPAKGLERLGHSVCINQGEADIFVFSKPMLNDYEIAEDVKNQGARVVFDVVDDHLTHPIFGPIYNKMIELADVLVSPTQNMAERVYRVSGRTPIVIPDPYEEEKQQPHATGDKLLWFGHRTNLKDLAPWKPYLNGITILTGPNIHEPVAIKAGKKLAQTQSINVLDGRTYLEWSLEAQTREFTNHNIVVIPTHQGAEYKSANRLVNAVRGGCFVVCSPHPSHEEFRSMAWVGNIKTGVDWARAFENELNDRVTEAQAYVEKFSPDAVAKLWEGALQ